MTKILIKITIKGAYAMINDEKYIRENIEKCIDDYHKSHELFNESLPTVVLNLLRVFEDSCRINPQAVLPLLLGLPHITDISTHNSLDSIDTAIKWAYQCCDKNKKEIDLHNIEKYYLKSYDVFKLADKYHILCDAFTYYSRKRYIAVYNENEKHLSFLYPNDNAGQKFDFIDFVEREEEKASYLYQDCFKENVRNISLVKEKLKRSITLKNRSEVEYSIEDDVWKAHYNACLMQIDSTKELPDDWSFAFFTMQEYRQVWAVLLTLALIHNEACLISGAEGMGLDSVILIKTLDELTDFVSEKSGIGFDKVKQVIDYLIYDENIKNNDIICQPLLKLDTNSVAISPSLFILSNSERNIACLINKKEQATYSRLSINKENLMIDEILQYLENNYSALKYKAKIKLPSPLPDIDLLCYDEKTKTILLCEMKFLISTDSIREICNRDEELLRGIEQAKAVLNYVKENFDSIIDRCFNIKTNKTIIGTVAACVVSKNNIGTSFIMDNEVPMVSKYRLFKLFEHQKGSLIDIINKLNGYIYFQDIDTSMFQVKYQTIEYAGYKFTSPGIEPKVTREEKKIGRNAPCPCGRINPINGKVYKYKKCCGKN